MRRVAVPKGLHITYGWHTLISIFGKRLIAAYVTHKAWFITAAEVVTLNTLRPKQNGHHFTAGILKLISWYENASWFGFIDMCSQRFNYQ